jgi:hypothetical protein
LTDRRIEYDLVLVQVGKTLFPLLLTVAQKRSTPAFVSPPLLVFYSPQPWWREQPLQEADLNRSFELKFNITMDVSDQWLRPCISWLGISSDWHSWGYGALLLLSIQVLVLYVGTHCISVLSRPFD